MASSISSSRRSWGADCPVSMPTPISGVDQETVPMHGFVYTSNGLFHDITEADHAAIRTPRFAPQHDPTLPVDYQDGEP